MHRDCDTKFSDSYQHGWSKEQLKYLIKMFWTHRKFIDLSLCEPNKKLCIPMYFKSSTHYVWSNQVGFPIIELMQAIKSYNYMHSRLCSQLNQDHSFFFQVVQTPFCWTENMKNSMYRPSKGVTYKLSLKKICYSLFFFRCSFSLTLTICISSYFARYQRIFSTVFLPFGICAEYISVIIPRV